MIKNDNNQTEGTTMTKDEAFEKYHEAAQVREYSEVKKVFPTREELVQFWDDVKHFSWPGSYGVSPWSMCGDVAYVVAGGTVTNPHVIASDYYKIAMSY